MYNNQPAYGGQQPPQYAYGTQGNPQQQQGPPSPTYGKQHQTSNLPGSASGNAGPGQSSSVKINSSPKYNDVWATVLFLIVLLSYIAVAYFGKLTLNEDFVSDQKKTQMTHFLQSLGITYLGNNLASVGDFIKTNARPILGSFFLSIATALTITVIYFFLMHK